MSAQCSRGSSGFTLIEIMVVLVIISIMMGVLIIRLPDSSIEDEQVIETQRLQALLRMASDEAVISGRELGFDAERNSYRFSQFDPMENRWQLMDEPPFLERTLDDGLTLKVKIEDQEFKLAAEDAEPSILLLSSGEVTPFDIEIRQSGDLKTVYGVSSDGYSGFEIITPDSDK